MSGRKSIIAVIFALIVCLVLIPTGVFAQDAEVQSEPDRTAEVSTSSETIPADNSGDTAEASTEDQTVDIAVNSETTVSVEDAIEESKEEAPTNDPVEDTVSDAETDTEIVEEPKVDEPEVIEEKSEVVVPVVETNLPTNDLLTQPDESAAQINSAEATVSQDEVVLDLDLSQGDVTIEDNDGDDSEKITVTGKDADGNEINKKVANKSTIRVSQSVETEEKQNVISVIFTKIMSFVTVILNKLNINNESKAPITVQTDEEDSTVTLELDGENKVTSTGTDNAAIRKSGEGELIIQDKTGDSGKLTAENKNAEETEGQAFDAHINRAAAIGGGETDNVGSITISGATVNAISNGSGAAIGSGKSGSVNEIHIEDNAKVTAESGRVTTVIDYDSDGPYEYLQYEGVGAAIGGGESGSVGSITISGAMVDATAIGYGAAIGTGSSGSVENITIEENSDVTATAKGYGAGIGGGGRDWDWGSVGDINIYNSKVKAIGGYFGAAIGGGMEGGVGNINIDNSEVNATGYEYGNGAGIGGGTWSSAGDININNSKVNATGYGNGAGIGGGMEGGVGNINIDNSEVNATGYGNGNGAGIGGGGWGGAGDININNSKVKAIGNRYGAAIGGGWEGSVGNINIDNSEVNATGYRYANSATIGGGAESGAGDINISNSKVEAVGRNYGAAIGGGWKGSVGNINIENSKVTAKQTYKAYNAAAIGGGENSTVGSITISGKSFIDATTAGKSAAVKTDNLDVSGLNGVEVIDTKTKHRFVINVHGFVVNPPNPGRNDEEKKPFHPFMLKKDALVEAKKDDSIVWSNVEIMGGTAKITVTDNKGRPVDPKEVTIKSVAAFEQTGAVEASIQLTRNLTVDLDVATMKEAAKQTGSTADVVTVTNEGSVITVKSGAAELVSVDVKAVVSAAKEPITVKFSRNLVRVICNGTVYAIDLTGLDGVGTLTLRLAKGVLKIYDSTGSLLMEVKRA